MLLRTALVLAAAATATSATAASQSSNTSTNSSSNNGVVRERVVDSYCEDGYCERLIERRVYRDAPRERRLRERARPNRNVQSERRMDRDADD